MELKQFYTKSINPIVQESFSCQWSEDDRISVVTKKGVHIFEIIFSPSQANPILKLSRTFINSPEVLPGEAFKDEISENISRWEKDVVYSFFRHEYYLPNFPKATKMVPEINNLYWSPKNLLKPNKCIIALLTSSGALQLSLQIERYWITVFEFTPVWLQVVNADSELLENCKESDPQLIIQKLERLLITAVTWSLLQNEPNDRCFAYLITGHRNSEIVIWKVYEVSCDTFTEDMNLDVELKYNKKLFDKNLKINTFLWIEFSKKNYYLIIGFHDGQIGILKLQESKGELTYQFYSTFFSHADMIPVDSLNVLNILSESMEIVAVKGINLLIFHLSINGKLISMNFITIPGFSISGISILNTKMILITTRDSKFFLIEKSEQSLKSTQLKIDSMKNSIQYLGLASSTNKMIFTLITSPSIVYDHLISREPSDILFFSIFNSPLRDPVDILYNTKSLFKTWDCIELIKICALKHNLLPSVLSQINLNLECISLHELKVAFWIMIISETLKNKSVHEISKPHKDVEKSKNLIFLYSAVNQLDNLSAKKTLTDVQKLSMSLLRNHLEIWLAGEEEEEEEEEKVERKETENRLLKMVKKVLEVTSKFNLEEQEKCNLCNSIIIEPWALTCSNGHQLPRCAITCLQVTCAKFRSCIICQAIFHPSLDEEMKEVRCLYCDKPAMYKYRILNPIFLDSNKNLSKKRILTSNNKESKEDEMKDG